MQELSILCENEEQEAFVLQNERNRGFDFIEISRLPPKNIQVLITANQVSNFKKQLDSHGIKYKVVIKDFQKMIEQESKAQKEAEINWKLNSSYSFDHFPRHHDVSCIFFIQK